MIITNSGEVQISLLVNQALEFEENKLNYSNHEVAAALLAFCMELKIPMPRSGVKELHENDECVFLKIKYQQDANFEEYRICNSMQNAHAMRA